MRDWQFQKHLGVVVCAVVMSAVGSATLSAQTTSPSALSAEDRGQIDKELRKLEDALIAIRPASAEKLDRWADADIFFKGATWALKYEPVLGPADVALVRKALA